MHAGQLAQSSHRSEPREAPKTHVQDHHTHESCSAPRLDAVDSAEIQTRQSMQPASRSWSRAPLVPCLTRPERKGRRLPDPEDSVRSDHASARHTRDLSLIFCLRHTMPVPPASIPSHAPWEFWPSVLPHSLPVSLIPIEPHQDIAPPTKGDLRSSPHPNRPWQSQARPSVPCETPLAHHRIQNCGVTTHLEGNSVVPWKNPT